MNSSTSALVRLHILWEISLLHAKSGGLLQGPKLTFLGGRQLAIENFFSVATWKNVVAKKCYFFEDGPPPQIYNNTKIGCILQMQRKGKK